MLLRRQNLPLPPYLLLPPQPAIHEIVINDPSLETENKLLVRAGSPLGWGITDIAHDYCVSIKAMA